MRRLLTGHAVVFNRRHRRKGHLFQNRYKSILCQEDPYFLELVRYIHLNPLRGKVVLSLDALDRYGYCGHSVLMGKAANEWQETGRVLGLFGERVFSARKKYRDFLEKGIDLGRRPDLVGGGLLRSSGGWKGLKSALEMGIHLKGDERILGDSLFVESVLEEQEEHFERRYHLQSQGYDFDSALEQVARIFDMRSEEILTPGKQPKRVAARSLACYWAVKELGINGTEVAQLMGVTQSAVSRAIVRGEQLALKNQYKFENNRNA